MNGGESVFVVIREVRLFVVVELGRVDVVVADFVVVDFVVVELWVVDFAVSADNCLMIDSLVVGSAEAKLGLVDLAMVEIAFVRNVVEEEMFGSASVTGVFDGLTVVVEVVVLYFEAVFSLVVVDVEEVVV